MRNDANNSPAQQKFLRELAENIHELAQPLSIIQASLELSLLSPITAEQHQDIAESALREVRRAVECMQFIGCLTRFQQPAVDVKDVCLSAALESTILDLQCTLEAAQIQVLFSRSENDPTIRISPARLRQMLFYVLQAVQGCSRAGDIVRIEIQRQAGYVVLWVEQCCNEREQTEPVNAFPVSETVVERALALADTIVRNAGGQLRVTTHPLLVIADFPSCMEATSACEETVDKNHLTDIAGTLAAVSSR
jgi:hypothetical protein